MMRNIYAKSGSIIIWLGPEANGSDGAMDSLKGGRREDILNVRISLEALMQRQYWTRAWTQQEASTPNVPCEVWCGTKRVTYEQFRKIRELNYLALDKIDTTKELRNTRDTRVASNMLNTYTRYRTEQAAQFGNLLIKYVHLEATDLRDRVYALLPIYEDLEKSHGYPMKVDYTVPAGEVFRHAMAWAIDSEKDYQLFMFCSAGSRVDAPSWVVDFSRLPVMTSRFEDRGQFWKFGAGYREYLYPEVRLEGGVQLTTSCNFSRRSFEFGRLLRMADEAQRVSVTGAEIGRITDTYGPPLGSYDWISTDGGVNVEQAAVWMEGAAKFAFTDSRDVPYVSGTSMVAAMNSILSTGLQSSSLYDTTWPYFDLAAGMGAPCLPGSRDREWSDIRCKNGVLFRTDDGHLGAGNSALRAGDVVVVILGVPIPMVLRPVGDMWEIVGSCFVSGRMEWLDNKHMWDQDGNQRTFLIC